VFSRIPKEKASTSCKGCQITQEMYTGRMASLYIVATPIGNLEDITLRARRVLEEVDLILCEDTRVTRKLLTRFKITTPTESYHAHSRFSKTEKILTLLRDGKNLALVSDSGTPTISDPGGHLVSLVREELGGEVSIVPVPGPNAAIAALSVSGLPSSDFLFLGFLPHKKGRQKLFGEVVASKRTIALYESPHRILKTLSVLAEMCTKDRTIVVARELTKIHEEIVSGSAKGVLLYFQKHPDKVRGEFVVIVSGE